MKIVIIEPFFTGSHAEWALGLQKNSNHKVEILKLNGSFWKWRMHGGAVSLARKFLQLTYTPDLIIVSDMLDLATFQALTREKTSDTPFALYFHENQLMYPWSDSDQDVAKNRDNHYSFINYTSALTADRIFFNSDYQRLGFLNELEKFLKRFPDNQELHSVLQIDKKSSTLHLGVDLNKFDKFRKKKSNVPTILWNHRWEHDKNPEQFFRILESLKLEGIEFKLNIVGESYSTKPSIFDEIKNKFGSSINILGYQESFEKYAEVVWESDIIPVTSNHDFFGISVVEAMYCNVYPLFPDRLVYPEHLSELEKSKHLYVDEIDLKHKLKNLILNERENFSSDLIQKYNWSNCIGLYDQTFEGIIK